MKVKINNAALAKSLGYRPEEVVEVECKNGVPIDREWRNRLRDAKIDNCVSIIEETKPKKGGK